MNTSELPHTITDIVCSFSGGRSSAMMAWILATDPTYSRFKKHFVFANTGRELSATIMFIKNCMWLFNIHVHFIEAEINPTLGIGTSYKLIEDHSKLSFDGEPYEAMIDKYGLPSIALPHCTRELKIVPISKFIKFHLGLSKINCVQAIGFRADEQKRINPKPQFIYPLNELGITKYDVNAFWKSPDRAPWDLSLEDYEGNCDFCFKKSWPKLKQMSVKHRSRMLWWNTMEEKYWVEGEAIFRGHKVILDLVEGAEHEESDLTCACGKAEDFFELAN